MKPCLILLSAILVIALASCGMDPSGGSGGKNTVLEWTVSTSGQPEVINGENWFSEPVDVTFTLNQDARISYTVDLHAYGSFGPSGSYIPETHTVQGRTVTIRCTEDCGINVSASTGNSSTSQYYSVRFKQLGRVKVDLGSPDGPMAEGTVEIRTNAYISFTFIIDSFVHHDWMSWPQVRYTTDGSDPHSSPTVKVVQMDENMCMEYIQLTPDMTRIRAYAVLDGWKSAPDTDIKIEIAKTADPAVSPSSGEEGDYEIIPYGDSITVTPGEAESVLWYTTNGNLTADDLDPSCWFTDPSTSWVRIPEGGAMTVPDGKGEFYLKVIACKEGMKPSEIIEKTYRVRIPEPECEEGFADAGDGKATAVFKRADGPSDTVAYYSYGSFSKIEATELNDGTGRFSVTVPNGTAISVWLEKDGFESSEKVSCVPRLKVSAPDYKITKRYDNRKYQLLTITPAAGTAVYYRLSGDSTQRPYTKAIELRETDTVTFWAVMEDYEDSDPVVEKIVVDYELGDVGPSGGVIIHDRGTYKGADWRYIELSNTSFSGQVFGYYGKKNGESVQSTGATENWQGGMGDGAVNSSLIYRAMIGGHAFAGTTGAGAFAKVTNPIDTTKKNSFAVKTAEEYYKEITLNDRTVIFDGWYLPSRKEITGLINSHILTNDPEMKVEASWITTGRYWTSDEYPDKEKSSVYVVTFNKENKSVSDTFWTKGSTATVIMMRKF